MRYFYLAIAIILILRFLKNALTKDKLDNLDWVVGFVISICVSVFIVYLSIEYW